MASILKHGGAEQKQRYLPRIASGELRLQSIGITEPDAGSETPRITTFARRQGDHYVINGQKIFTSRYQHSDMLLPLTRTTPFDEVKKKTDGMSLFLVNLKESGDAIKAVPIATMVTMGPTSFRGGLAGGRSSEERARRIRLCEGIPRRT